MRIKIKELENYLKFNNPDQYSGIPNSKIVEHYLSQISAPKILLDIDKPNETVEYWIKDRGDKYNAFCFQLGCWWQIKSPGWGFWEFHQPRLTFEEYQAIKNLKTVDWRKVFSESAKKDYAWWSQWADIKRIRFETMKGFRNVNE